MKPMKKHELLRLLHNKGFVQIRKGKHEIYSNGEICIAVPNHIEIASGTLRDILKQIA